MAKLIHVERGQVKDASAEFEELMAKDPDGKRELEEWSHLEKAEKKLRDREYRANKSEVKTRTRRSKQ